MINLDIDPDQPPSPTNHLIIHTPPNNSPPSLDNDRQEQLASPINPKKLPLKDPFPTKSSTTDCTRQNGAKGKLIDKVFE